MRTEAQERQNQMMKYMDEDQVKKQVLMDQKQKLR